MYERSWEDVIASRGYTKAFIENVRRKRAAANATKQEEKLQANKQASADVLYLRLPSRMARIVIEVAGRHGVRPEELLSKSVKQRFVKARNEAWYLIKADAPEKAFKAIARHFDRNHTVLMYGVAAHAHANSLPSFTAYDIEGQRAKKAESARTRYLWDKAA